MSSSSAANEVKKPRPTWLRNLSLYFTEYCDNSTIHGLKFLGEQGRSIIEKIWWLIFVGLSLYFCVSLILNTYNKWMNSPVIVSFATSETPIWKVPFPAVTICPLIKYDTSRLNFTTKTTYEATNLEYLSLVCPKILESFPEINGTDNLNDSSIEFLLNVAPDFGKTIFNCQWMRGKCYYQADEYFVPILTSGGVCYSFNMLDRDEIFTNATDYDYYQALSIKHQPMSNWSVEDGYPDDAELVTYPRRTMLIGTNGGVELVLRTSLKENSFSCGSSLQGYKVLLHHPSRLPRFNQHYFWVPLNELVSVAVKANMITTSKELKSYDPEDRKCYFKTEKILRFFKVYNQQNCLFECVTNYTYQKCDCVGFYMPRDNSMPICGPAKLWCLKEANTDFVARQATFQMRRLKKSKKFRSKIQKSLTGCNCLPPCHSLHFDAETSQLNWNWRQEYTLNDSYNNDRSHLSRIRIYFKNLQFMTSERNELYGQTEFWANCGGLLGLFTGFSFISLIEIIYFATLRFICNVRKFGWPYWSGAEELLEIKVNT